MELQICLVLAAILISVQKDLTSLLIALLTLSAAAALAKPAHASGPLFSLPACGVLFLCLFLRAGSCLASREASLRCPFSSSHLASACPFAYSLLHSWHRCLPHRVCLCPCILCPVPPPRPRAPGEQEPCLSQSALSPGPTDVCAQQIFVERGVEERDTCVTRPRQASEAGAPPLGKDVARAKGTGPPAKTDSVTHASSPSQVSESYSPRCPGTKEEIHGDTN